MEIPRLGAESELQLPATAVWDLSCVCDLHHSLWQCRILNFQSEARYWTCTLMDTSRIRFLCTTVGIPAEHILNNLMRRDFGFSIFFIFLLFRATSVAHGVFQARGLIGATAAGQHHSHSNTGSLTHWARPGIEAATLWFLVGFVSAAPWRSLWF